MVCVDSEKFLTELMHLFSQQKSKGKGSVFLTMKQYTPRVTRKSLAGSLGTSPGSSAAASSSAGAGAHDSDHAHHRCLIRATLGSRTISTHITQKEVTKFQLAFGNVIKASMDSLKKKEKKDKKDKGKAGALSGAAAASSSSSSSSSSSASGPSSSVAKAVAKKKQDKATKASGSAAAPMNVS